MKSRFILPLVAALIAVLCISCKEKEEETKYMSFVGDPEFELPTFIKAGDKHHLTPKTVKRSADDNSTLEPGCRWYLSDGSTPSDTVRWEGDPSYVPYDYDLTVPDSLESVTVTCCIFADGYTDKSFSCTAIVVRTDGPLPSLQGVNFPAGSGTFSDTRDNMIYHYITVDGTDWMAENLAWAGCGTSYLSAPLVDVFFGRYYTWTEASTACPDGWTLPTNADFLALNNAFVDKPTDNPYETFPVGAGHHMANAYFNYQKLWEYWPDVTPVNTSGFSLLPVGYVIFSGEMKELMDMMAYGMVWTGEQYGEKQAYYRSVNMRYDKILIETGYRDNMAMSVRCVRKSD